MKQELAMFPKQRVVDMYSLTQNVNLAKYLNKMVWLGFLPISWIEDLGPELKFKISRKKSLMFSIVDAMIAVAVIAHMIIWHLVYAGPDFDLTLIFKPEYYLKVFRGSATNASTELGFVFMPMVFCWVFVKIGRDLKGLNMLLSNPWFEPRPLRRLFFFLTMTTGLVMHSIGINTKFIEAAGLPKKKIWHYISSAIINSASGTRMILFMYLTETLLEGLLRGWEKGKPNFRLRDCRTDDDWEKVKHQTVDWINFYGTIEESFGSYLLFAVGTSVPTTILLVYMILSQIMSPTPEVESYAQYSATGLMLVGFVFKIVTLSTACDHAFEVINKAKKEVTLSNAATGETEKLFKHRRDILVSILDSSVPLNGLGFFQVNNSILTSVVGAATTYIVVLMQFAMSEFSANKSEPNNSDVINSNNTDIVG